MHFGIFKIAKQIEYTGALYLQIIDMKEQLNSKIAITKHALDKGEMNIADSHEMQNILDRYNYIYTYLEEKEEECIIKLNDHACANSWITRHVKNKVYRNKNCIVYKFFGKKDKLFDNL